MPTVIIAVGYCPQGLTLVNWLKESGKYPYCVIGDANRAGSIGTALQEAWQACR